MTEVTTGSCKICKLCRENTQADEIVHNKKFLQVLSIPQVMNELTVLGVDTSGQFKKCLSVHYRKHLSKERTDMYLVQSKRTKHRKDSILEFGPDSLQVMHQKRVDYSMDLVSDLKRHLYSLKLQADAYEKELQDKSKTLAPSRIEHARLIELNGAYAKGMEQLVRITSIQSVWQDLILRIFDKLSMEIMQRHLDVAEKTGMTTQERELLVKELRLVIHQNVVGLDKMCRRYLP